MWNHEKGQNTSNFDLGGGLLSVTRACVGQTYIKPLEKCDRIALVPLIRIDAHILLKIFEPSYLKI